MQTIEWIVVLFFSLFVYDQTIYDRNGIHRLNLLGIQRFEYALQKWFNFYFGFQAIVLLLVCVRCGLEFSNNKSNHSSNPGACFGQKFNTRKLLLKPVRVQLKPCSCSTNLTDRPSLVCNGNVRFMSATSNSSNCLGNCLNHTRNLSQSTCRQCGNQRTLNVATNTP